MTRLLVLVLAFVAVCAAKPADSQSNLLREVMKKLGGLQARSMDVSQDKVRLAAGLTAMGLIQKCEMYFYMEELDPMEVVANYFIHGNKSGESILDHACPVIVLIVVEYMKADGDAEINAVTDSLIPLIEEAMCVDIILNKEVMMAVASERGLDLNDRLDFIKEGENHLIEICEDEFEKGDADALVNDLLNKYTGDGNSGTKK